MSRNGNFLSIPFHCKANTWVPGVRTISYTYRMICIIIIIIIIIIVVVVVVVVVVTFKQVCNASSLWGT